jgi:hypothetical protein
MPFQNSDNWQYSTPLHFGLFIVRPSTKAIINLFDCFELKLPPKFSDSCLWHLKKIIKIRLKFGDLIDFPMDRHETLNR